MVFSSAFQLYILPHQYCELNKSSTSWENINSGDNYLMLSFISLLRAPYFWRGCVTESKQNQRWIILWKLWRFLFMFPAVVPHFCHTVRNQPVSAFLPENKQLSRPLTLSTCLFLFLDSNKQLLVPNLTPVRNLYITQNET